MGDSFQDGPVKELVKAIRLVKAGESWLDPSITRKVIVRMAGQNNKSTLACQIKSNLEAYWAAGTCDQTGLPCQAMTLNKLLSVHIQLLLSYAPKQQPAFLIVAVPIKSQIIID